MKCGSASQALHIRTLTLEGARRLFDETGARRSSGVATDLDVLMANLYRDEGERDEDAVRMARQLNKVALEVAQVLLTEMVVEVVEVHIAPELKLLLLEKL